MKKKWYQTSWGIVVVLLLFFPAGLYLMWKRGTWKKRTKWIVTAVYAFLTFLFIITPSSSPSYQEVLERGKQATSSQQPVVEQQKAAPTAAHTVAPTVEPQKPKYEVVDKQERPNLENIKVLVSAGVDGKAVAQEVKKHCKKDCNIDIFDDRKALNLQKQYDQMMGSFDTDPSELDAWKKQNYVFVAEHLVGYITFDTGEYTEYPLKDWYYKELKGN